MAGHKIKPERAGHLDSRLRRFLTPVDRILADLQPGKTEAWVDIGAGTGYFALPLSLRVEAVYALDISEAMLGMLKENIEAGRAGDITVMKSEENSLPLADGTADAVLLAFVAHEVDDPAVFFGELARITRPGGRLCVIEFGKSRSFGPPRDHRLTTGQLDGWADGSGFEPDGSWRWTRSLLGWKYVDLVGLQYQRRP